MNAHHSSCFELLLCTYSNIKSYSQWVWIDATCFYFRLSHITLRWSASSYPITHCDRITIACEHIDISQCIFVSLVDISVSLEHYVKSLCVVSHYNHRQGGSTSDRQKVFRLVYPIDHYGLSQYLKLRVRKF